MAESAPVLTLRDLGTWSRPGTSLAVLGHPIKHSISPAMHNAALAELARSDARFSDWSYFRFEVPPDDLPRALALLHAKHFRGVNLTVPHKIIAFDRVAEIDPAARPVGAVNTLLWGERGWRGFNTDGYGLAGAVRETLARDLTGADVILLGAGGAARGAAVECLQRGCASLSIINRTRETLDALLTVLKPVAGEIHLRGFCPVSGVHSDLSAIAMQIPSATRDRDLLIVNATSAGLRPDDPLPVDLRTLQFPAAVYDMIYNPPQTPLLREATTLGLPNANGLSMLVHQGAKALEIWSGIPAARTAPTMTTAVRAALGLAAR
jgi:shikimate dehydrogenase